MLSLAASDGAAGETLAWWGDWQMWITGLPAGVERYADKPVGVLGVGPRSGTCGTDGHPWNSQCEVFRVRG
ncbi:hypothetical protein E2C01_054530 [Portunus trituberculatus]|uniref:Uncharacterized protein n=1 Tax=Portunus trituberculatus TaxID=210409 RepID=A0A5B7GSX3_PORTR|nr:hypothetical protein [Portunus trituberculatus]